MHELLKALAKANKLEVATENAKKVMAERLKKRQERGEAMDED
jgi:hypothetical protein